MDALTTKDLILIIIATFSVLIFAFVVSDVVCHIERYESTFFQFFVAFLLLSVLCINNFIAYQLYQPKTTMSEEIVFSHELSSPPKKISSSGIVVVDKQEDGSDKRIILDVNEYDVEESEDNIIHFAKVNQIKTDDFFLFGKKVEEEKKITKSFYRLYLPKETK